MALLGGVRHFSRLLWIGSLGGVNTTKRNPHFFDSPVCLLYLPSILKSKWWRWLLINYQRAIFIWPWNTKQYTNYKQMIGLLHRRKPQWLFIGSALNTAVLSVLPADSRLLERSFLQCGEQKLDCRLDYRMMLFFHCRVFFGGTIMLINFSIQIIHPILVKTINLEHS